MTKIFEIFDATLHMMVNAVDDLENVRIATDNRYRTLTMPEEKGGFNLTENDLAVQSMALQSKLIHTVEAEAVKTLEKQMARHPLGPWISQTPGLGMKSIARLLGAVGDPYWHEIEQRPRLLSEFRSYCGLGDASVQRLSKGHKVSWSPEARKRFFVVSKVIKMNRRSKYHHVYDEAKIKYADAVHDAPCSYCTPKGQPPAEIGTPLKNRHKDARAVRAVSKAVAKDLWLESKRIHEEAVDVAA